MILIEYSYFDIASNENEVKENLIEANKYKLSGISIFPYYIKIAKNILNPDLLISCPIDYPYGILDSKSRLCVAESVIKAGAKAIDAVVPSHYLSNRKYDKFREDIKNLKTLCDLNNIILRYILEYRIYSYELLYRICQILLEYGVDTVIPSSGHGLDDISDNILASALIHKKNPSLKIICNGNIWSPKHIELIEKANLPQIRVNSINALHLLDKKFNTL
jgi:deoxyribose-phosphate aldolase